MITAYIDVLTRVGIWLCTEKCDVMSECRALCYLPNSLTCFLLTTQEESAKIKCSEGLFWESPETNRCQVGSYSRDISLTSGQNICVRASLKCGTKCTYNAECDYEHGRCLRGVCFCKIGFIYNFDRCVARWKTFDGKCSNDYDCNYDYGQCLRGRCSCVIGYSFDFEYKTCVTKCNHAGSIFSKYDDSGIHGCNDKTIRITDEKECMLKCRDEPSFVCMNAEIEGETGECNLCHSAWFDLPLKDRSDGTSPGWSFLYRNCNEHFGSMSD